MVQTAPLSLRVSQPAEYERQSLILPAYDPGDSWMATSLNTTLHYKYN